VVAAIAPAVPTVPATAAATSLPKPMLASAMTARPFEFYANDGWVQEPKLDGIRWLVEKTGTTVRAFARPQAGKDTGNEHAIPADLKAVLLSLPDGLYDGELVTPGGKSWNVMELGTAKQFVAFDVLTVLGQSVMDLPYLERRALLDMAIQHVGQTPLVQMTPSTPVSKAAAEALMAAGGEGVVLKRVASRYQPGRRSEDWVKHKAVQQATVTITGFEQGKGASSTPWSVTTFVTDDGIAGKVKTINNATVDAIAKNPDAWIGRRLVVQYQILTDDGRFRHPMWDHEAGSGE
jgi:bifunctional non-homologous end joining protein LigD